MGRTACTEPQCLYKGDLYLTFYCYIILAVDTKFESVHTWWLSYECGTFLLLTLKWYGVCAAEAFASIGCPE